MKFILHILRLKYLLLKSPKWLLKANYFVFAWYYKRVPEFFHSWTFFKSVKLLIENYKSIKSLHEEDKQFYKKVMEKNTQLHNEISDMKIQQIAKVGQIKWANKNFGTNYTETESN